MLSDTGKRQLAGVLQMIQQVIPTAPLSIPPYPTVPVNSVQVQQMHDRTKRLAHKMVNGKGKSPIYIKGSWARKSNKTG